MISIYIYMMLSSAQLWTNIYKREGGQTMIMVLIQSIYYCVHDEARIRGLSRGFKGIY